MKKIIILAITVLAFAVAGKEVMAATATGTLDVTASVANSCTVNSTANVAFGVYDPTSTTDNTAGGGNFVFRCVKNTPFSLHIARTNTMNDGGPNNLTYDLYSDVGRTTAWATAAAADPAGESPAASNAAKTRNIYGKIPALQDVPAGSYSETVTVTVTY